jgi:hypothetical protein
MHDKYETFINSVLISHGWVGRKYRVSIVGNHLVLTVGEGFHASIVYFDLDEVNGELYKYRQPIPIRNISEVVSRKYRLEDVE